MSSILKALKQLEQETGESVGEPLTPFEPETASDMLPPSARRRRRQRRIRLSAGAFALGTAAALGVFWAAALDRPDAGGVLSREVGVAEQLPSSSPPAPVPSVSPPRVVADPELAMRVVVESPPVAPAAADPEPATGVVVEPPPVAVLPLAGEAPPMSAPPVGKANLPEVARAAEKDAAPFEAAVESVRVASGPSTKPIPTALSASSRVAITPAPASRAAVVEPDRAPQPPAARAIREPVKPVELVKSVESVEPVELVESEPAAVTTPLPGLESTRWHPAPERREAHIVVAGQTRRVEQADLVSGYRVIEITPSAVVLGRGDETFRVRVGSR